MKIEKQLMDFRHLLTLSPYDTSFLQHYHHSAQQHDLAPLAPHLEARQARTAKTSLIDEE